MRARKLLRFQNYNYSGGGMYFITILTKNRKCCLSKIKDYEAELLPPGKVVEKVWNTLTFRYAGTILDQYVIMPNHLHGIIGVLNDEPGIIESNLQSQAIRRKMLLSKMIGYFKMNSAKEINVIQSSATGQFWHRNYFERIIRNEIELDNIREYIYYNPAKWQMDCENPHNYTGDEIKLNDYYNKIWNTAGGS